MSLFKTAETYNSEGSLSANAGDWIDGVIDFTQTRQHVGSGTSNKCTHTVPAVGVNVFTFDNYDWIQNGWQVGDVCSCVVGIDFFQNFKFVASGLWGTPTATQTVSQTISFTITAISNNSITTTAPIISLPSAFPLVTSFSSPTVFPTTARSFVLSSNPVFVLWRFYTYKGISISGPNNAEQIDFEFNLAPNSTSNMGSVIDGEMNRFSAITANLPTGNSMPMTQYVNKSGGVFDNCILTKRSIAVDGSIQWRIDFKFLQWGVIEDGFSNPTTFYDNIKHIAPIGKVKVYGNAGNPNTVKDFVTSEPKYVQGNTGGYNENHNGFPNHFSTQSIQWTDVNNNPISAMDYSGTSKFKAIVNAQGINANSKYNIGLIWRPEDSSIYKNKPSNLGENLLLNAPFLTFQHSLPSTAIHTGYTDPSGAKWDLTDLSFQQIGTQLQVTGTVIPNGACNTLFSGIANGGRKTTLWISIANPNIPQNVTDRVSLILWDDDNIDAPTLGVQIPDVVEEALYDHDNNVVTNFTNPNTTTEDDMLYKSAFLLPDNIVYNGMRVRISAHNVLSNDEFILENQFIDFSNVVIQNGQHQPNITLNRGFNLPPTTDRNWISVKRKSAIDIAGKYGVELEYGFLNDWRYWLLQPNVHSNFYNITEPHSGKNKNWQKFYDGANWRLRIAYFLDKSGIEDFNYLPFKIRPYEDDVNVTAVTTFLVLSTLATPTQLVNNELIEITTVFNWNQNFSDEWVEFTVEDFEGGNRWVMSSILDQGNVLANPLKPIATNTKINVTGTGTNTLTCKALIDTSIINANKVSLSFRVFSTPNGDIPVDGAKQKTDGTYKQKTDGTVKLKA